MFAIVDIFTDNANQIALTELELIEPKLCFQHYPEAATIVAKAIVSKILMP